MAETAEKRDELSVENLKSDEFACSSMPILWSILLATYCRKFSATLG